MLEMFKYETADELIGQRIEVLIPSRYSSNHVKMRNGFIKEPAIRPMGQGQSLSARRKDDTEFPVEISLSYYGQEDMRIIAFISDISERQAIENEVVRLNSELEKKLKDRTRKINAQNRLLLSISRNFPDGNIYVVDRDFKIIMADGTLLREQGFDENTLVGHSFIERIKNGIRGAIELNLNAVFGGSPKDLELEVEDKIFSLIMVPLEQMKGENQVNRVLIVEMDVTVSKRVERDIKQALQKEKDLNQLKSNFVSLVSHEFRTPLSTIFSSSQLIEKYANEEGQKDRMRHTGKIQTSVSLLNSMIEDILSLSKLEEGGVVLKLESFDLFSLCENIIADLNSIYPEMNIALKGEEVSITSDPKLLKHVLSNIIENGCKYGKPGGKVKVLITASDDEVELTVSDNGIGIPPEEQKNLFDRFYRASNAENIKGTGLGLNIVQKYLDLLGGNIRFDSILNEGTDFYITLPKK